MTARTPFLTRFEERFVFRVSRTVWHGVVAIAVTGMIGGVTVLGWSAIPPAKRDITKEAYPTPISVSLSELEQALKPGAKVAAKPAATTPKTPSGADKEQSAFNAALARLHAQFPASHYVWNDEMGWEYPYGEELWNYAQDEDYRRWVVKVEGLETWVRRQLNDVKDAGPGEQAQVLDAYTAIVTKLPVPERRDVLRSLGFMTVHDVPNSLARIQAIGAVLSPLPADRPRFAQKAAEFMTTREGGTIEVVAYFGKTLAAFAAPARVAVLDALIGAYGSPFAKDGAQEQEAVEAFLPLIGKIAPSNQAKALTTFLRLYGEKNAQRQTAIRDINSRYDTAVQQAETEFGTATAAKESSRLPAVYVVAGGIATTAMVALLLVLLSIQRYLKLIVDRVAGDEPPAASDTLAESAV